MWKPQPMVIFPLKMVIFPLKMVIFPLKMVIFHNQWCFHVEPQISPLISPQISPFFWSIEVFGRHFEGSNYRRLLMGRNMEADLPRDEDAALKSHLDGGEDLEKGLSRLPYGDIMTYKYIIYIYMYIWIYIYIILWYDKLYWSNQHTNMRRCRVPIRNGDTKSKRAGLLAGLTVVHTDPPMDLESPSQVMLHLITSKLIVAAKSGSCSIQIIQTHWEIWLSGYGFHFFEPHTSILPNSKCLSSPIFQ